MPTDALALCPSQQRALDRLVELWPCSDVFVLWSRDGMGRSTTLRALARQVPKPVTLDAGRYLRDLSRRDPLQLEEAFLDRALKALDRCETLLIDDFDRISCTWGSCNYHYPRSGLQKPALSALLEAARAAGRKVVFVGAGKAPDEIDARCLYVGWKRLELDDYKAMLGHHLGDGASAIDTERIFAFAPRLSLLQLKGALEALKVSNKGAITTTAMISHLERLKMASNVSVEQVREVTLEDLKGVDDVLAGLKRYVVTPLAEEELARTWGVKPKRGILLHGPPGTGKTTVGRALAHRLRSKFFRIDGTFVTRSNDFHQRIHQVFAAARDNAPSLVFIDDCDTIFEDKDDYGLYRYLLTMMDGLESEEMAQVCVMLTAMDVGSLPPALIRSGRIELWLEMTRPDRAARADILKSRLGDLASRTVDISKIAEDCEGFTGADLNRLVADARTLLIGELAQGRDPQDLTPLFGEAVAEVRRNMEAIQKARAAAEARNAPSADPFAYFKRFARPSADDDSPTEA